MAARLKSHFVWLSTTCNFARRVSQASPLHQFEKTQPGYISCWALRLIYLRGQRAGADRDLLQAPACHSTDSSLLSERATRSTLRNPDVPRRPQTRRCLHSPSQQDQDSSPRRHAGAEGRHLMRRGVAPSGAQPLASCAFGSEPSRSANSVSKRLNPAEPLCPHSGKPESPRVD